MGTVEMQILLKVLPLLLKLITPEMLVAVFTEIKSRVLEAVEATETEVDDAILTFISTMAGMNAELILTLLGKVRGYFATSDNEIDDLLVPIVDMVIELIETPGE